MFCRLASPSCISSRITLQINIRRFLQKNDNRRRRLDMFNSEKARQDSFNGQKIEKSLWNVITKNGKETKVLMNKNISSYLDCIKHISRLEADRTALVLSDGEYKSAHEKIAGEGTVKPLEYNCRDEADADAVNQAYWRTCAFVLGATVENSFNYDVQLINGAESKYSSGRFVYSVKISDLSDWIANQADLFALTQKAVNEYAVRSFAAEPLTVSVEFANDLFENNPVKQTHIEKLASFDRYGQAKGVVVYKLGDFVDVVDGPLISTSSHIGKFAITEVLKNDDEYQFVGVSVPRVLKCSSYSWDIICDASVTRISSIDLLEMS